MWSVDMTEPETPQEKAFTERTQTETPALSTSAPGRHFPMLLGLEGPLKGRRFVLDKQVISIGRDMLADILLKDNRASRQHSRIIYVNIQQKDEAPVCRLFDAGSTNGTFLNQKKVGAGGAPLTDKDRIQIGRTVFGFYIREDQDVKADEVFEILAAQDEISGLFNRSTFLRILAREIERARRYQRHLAFLLLDLDDLDTIAEHYGPATRNTLLRKVGFLLAQGLRAQDVAGSIGPKHEMAILLPETPPVGAQQVGERLCKKIAEETFQQKDTQVHSTASVGVAMLSWDTTAQEELVRLARKALESARSQGGNRAVVSDGAAQPTP
jgi:two-component system, cell cycle response regulator